MKVKSRFEKESRWLVSGQCIRSLGRLSRLQGTQFFAWPADLTCRPHFGRVAAVLQMNRNLIHLAAECLLCIEGRGLFRGEFWTKVIGYLVVFIRIEQGTRCRENRPH